MPAMRLSVAYAIYMQGSCLSLRSFVMRKSCAGKRRAGNFVQRHDGVSRSRGMALFLTFAILKGAFGGRSRI